MTSPLPRPTPPPYRAGTCASFTAVALLIFTGCSSTPAPRGGRWVVTAPQAEFFRHGPAQAAKLPAELRPTFTLPNDAGPDFQLPRGAVVTMLRREFGFSRVATEDGQTGYVANEQLKPAPALASTAPTELRRPPTPRGRNKPGPAAPRNEERLDLSDIDLPLPI